ncbi:uncharacterized protein LOC108330224 [Vigna angularis]|uniref:uncharacterized protein LOC108330224 n=1 Tax=Phaseolus angularis TaxID=3914 RepID=UPI0022B50C4E|nr:uncharacterized protein LOC108330224 [Vigna angularis]
MASRPHPQPIERDSSDHIRLLGSVIKALQQLNAALVQQNMAALQSLEAIRAHSEATQRQLMEITEITRNIIGASTSSGDHRTELSLECFRHHHPAKLTEKYLPDEVERTQVFEKSVTELEQHKEQQQQTIREAISSRNNDDPRRTPYDRSVSPSASGGLLSQCLVTAGRSGQKKDVKCFKCGGPHFRSSCPQLLGVKTCIHCGRNGHLKRECNMGGQTVTKPSNTWRNQPGSGGQAQADDRVMP